MVLGLRIAGARIVVRMGRGCNQGFGRRRQGRTLAIGAERPDFTFKDLRYASHSLKDLGEKKAYVVVFSSLDCPVAKRICRASSSSKKNIATRTCSSS